MRGKLWWAACLLLLFEWQRRGHLVEAAEERLVAEELGPTL